MSQQILKYTSGVLRALNLKSRTLRPTCELSKRINLFKINAKGNTQRPFRRGSRAGIHVKTFHSQIPDTRNGCNISNLIPIQRSEVSFTKVNKKLSLVNARSLCNKTAEFRLAIEERDTDICAVTETWLREDDSVTLHNVSPPGYKFLSTPRGARGGGVGLLYKATLDVKQRNVYEFESMECTDYILKPSRSSTFRVAVIYRKPDLPIPSFISDLSSCMEINVNAPGELIILGDLNIHVNSEADTGNINFQDFVSSFRLKCWVSFPTHKNGNTLDLLLTDEGATFVREVSCGDLFSDHHFVHCDIVLQTEVKKSEVISYRKLKAIDHEEFARDLNLELSHRPETGCEDLASFYDSTLRKLLDNHAPLKLKSVKVTHREPWYDDSIGDAIRLRRKLEKKWKSDRSNTQNYQLFYKQRRLVSNLIDRSEKQYYNNVLSEHKYDFKQVFQIANSLLGRNESLPLPPCEDAALLASGFNQFFTEKVEHIRLTLQDAIYRDNLSSNEFIESEFQTEHRLLSYKPYSEDSMKKLISKAAPKSCESDPVPTKLLLQHLDTVLPVLMELTNCSLSEGIFPACWKKALVRPLLKKKNLETIWKNYRPVSNLPYVSKLLERAVADYLVQYIDVNNLMEPYQSAYRVGHSTETALLKVRTDLLECLNNQEVCCLVLLDLSAAFDTVDHALLLNRLKYRFGIDGTALKWLASYLDGRSQSVVIGDIHAHGAHSAPSRLTFGVPQGSVLGPILFTLYTCPLGDICRKHGLQYHLYADDSQLYFAFKPSVVTSKETCLIKIKKCVDEISTWMTCNLLKLNQEKTEFIMIGTYQQLNKALGTTIEIGDEVITSTEAVRNLGFQFDSQLKNRSHIDKLCRSLYLTIRGISKMRNHLTQDACKILMQALVLSKIDYANSLLLGTAKGQLKRLQLLQNMAARVILRLQKWDHISYGLQNLHWLKVEERIEYKVATLIYKALHGDAPGYLADFVKKADPQRELRSSAKIHLDPKYCNNSQTKSSSFKYQAPRIWNELPTEIKTAESLDAFKSKLKTLLFSKSYK